MRPRSLIIVFLFLLFVISTGYLVYDSIESYRFARSNERMAETIEKDSNDESSQTNLDNMKILPKFSAIYEKNKEFAGWIKIDGTMIDYPVMKPEEDNHYYLTHSPEGLNSKFGSIYLDVSTDLQNTNTNYLLYGHYFRDGSMFGTIENYKDKSYYEEHPYITFDTLYEEGTYEVISVFLSQIYRKDQDVFKYYQYTNMSSEEEFETYVNHIMEMSLYDTGKSADYGDSLITLSTCDYWTENGRLAVVAKKVTDRTVKNR